ncbi:SU10 major capsid protein [Enterovirga aerilata]|uniref:DUF5309 domain-containing protein n=1 Tax=Enterovirga aerilata TaxID=2730920 RepID=A0A849I4J7_9HYPH|nr:DUF5309 family protein [Enterovirga sp. DB1703]NNM74756.1 DUF5309 domain-containing protein [Enterovirga sp. DB1703]
MPKVQNAYTTRDAKANREDLSDIIYNIDPFDTPFFTMAGRRNVRNVIFDWQTEKLPGVDIGNRRVEGFVLDRQPSTPTIRLSNTVQISERDATVSGTQEAVDAAGKGSEMAHQMALAGKALKRDMESIALGPQPRIDATDDNTARQTRGLEHWIKTNVNAGAGYVPPDDAYDTIVDGTQRVFTEALFLDTLQMAYDNGAEPTEAFIGSWNKRVFTGFAGRNNSQVMVGKSEVVNSVDIYASDFGRIRTRPSRWHRQRTVLILDPNYVKIAFLRNFRTRDMAKIGDAETKMLLAEWGVEVGNEAAHAKIADLTTSAA